MKGQNSGTTEHQTLVSRATAAILAALDRVDIPEEQRAFLRRSILDAMELLTLRLDGSHQSGSTPRSP